MANPITTALNPSPAELASAMRLRERVFVDEQRVPPELEHDEHDKTAAHVVLLQGSVAIATGRVRLVDAGLAKVERVAVDASLRRTGLGRLVMSALEERASGLGAARVKLAAQVSAIPFYEAIGYVAKGDVFMDAGIAHRWMSRELHGA